jgi:hypothetical protein
MPVFCLFTLGRHNGTARFVVYCTCAKYRVVEYYRVCRFIDVILECCLTPHEKCSAMIMVRTGYISTEMVIVSA